MEWKLHILRFKLKFNSTSPGSSFCIKITGTVTTSSDIQDWKIENEVNVSSDTEDPTDSNNSCKEETDVISRADVELDKSISHINQTEEPDKYYNGERVRYTITLTNNGPQTALGERLRKKSHHGSLM